ncbi:hypothetical protein B0T17DRAFT_598537 [Bombardia bombarda]|uniref:Zn(2)-C6 fungal-type domain-containing protein n=1 Tax=Bombardia bombarda TaxID=252184 RepID=A0AA39XAF3_9PEZI|nr:hypothetical protein B0T17DRAFT_598537 [Bombardia bombarda]
MEQRKGTIDTSATSPGAAAGGANRHLACNRCRIRKVKCDGRKPFCKRCASGQAAWECTYPCPAKKGRPKRIAQSLPSPASSHPDGSKSPCPSGNAEASNSTSTPSFDSAVLLSSNSLKSEQNLLDDLLHHHETHSDQIMFDELLQQDIENGDHLIFDDLMRQDDSNGDDLFSPFYHSMDPSTCSNTRCRTPDNLTIDLTDEVETPPEGIAQLKMLRMELQAALDSQAGATAKPQIPQPPPELRDLMFSTYFKSCQSTLRLFDDPERLAILTRQSSCDSIALRYAVFAHAAPLCAQFSVWAAANMDMVAPGEDYANFFYRLAHSALEQCNIEQKFSTPSLQALQSAILVGLYELQHAEFGLAWLTASRAVWLAQMMQLYSLDSEQSPDFDSEHLEEARKAMWGANSLTCFLITGGRLADSVSIEEVTTSLPQSSVNQKLSIPGVNIGDVFRKASPRPLSFHEGQAVCRMLAQRVIVHVKKTRHTSMPDQQPYNFWTNQHRLEEIMRYVLNITKSSPSSSAATNSSSMCAAAGSGAIDSSNTPKVVLTLHIKALMIVIYEAKLRKMRSTTQSPNQNGPGQIRSTENSLLQRALEIAEAVQTSVLATDAATHLTVTWSVYVALQSLLRQRRRSSSAHHPPQQQQQQQQQHQQQLEMTAWTACSSGDSIMGGFGSYDMGSITCGNAMGGFESADSTMTLAGALVLDTFNVLHNALTEWSDKSPVAAFFVDQIEMESGEIDGALDKRLVGLGDFALWNCWSLRRASV